MTDLNRIARKITLILFAAQSLASAGFIAAATINPILGAKFASHRYLATLPSAAYLLSSAFAAPMWGVLMDRIGRRNAISSGRGDRDPGKHPCVDRNPGTFLPGCDRRV